MLEQELLLPELCITACLHLWTAITYAHILPLPTLTYSLETGFAAVPSSFAQVPIQGFWASLGSPHGAQRPAVVATDYPAAEVACGACFPVVQSHPPRLPCAATNDQSGPRRHVPDGFRCRQSRMMLAALKICQ